MDDKKIVVLDSGYDSFAYEEMLFSGAGYKFEIFPGARHDRSGKMRFAADAEGILIRWTEIDDEFLKATPRLKAIVRYGVGYDNIQLESANRFHVKVSNVQGYANDAVSDHAMAMIYACGRALVRGKASLLSNFGAAPIPEILEFHDKTIGIIGLGRIGGTLCKKIRPLFRIVLASDPYITDERFEMLGARKATLDDLLAESDVISIHCNLTEETKGLISRASIARMKKVPILVNTSRGPVVDEDDLYRALEENRLHSVGLDVFHNEPPKANRQNLLNHPRVLATGHYAWYSTRSAVELQKRAADNLLSMLKGEVPEDCLNC
jgi:D-3-phosphoglycerate dehydrogenase